MVISSGGNDECVLPARYSFEIKFSETVRLAGSLDTPHEEQDLCGFIPTDSSGPVGCSCRNLLSDTPKCSRLFVQNDTRDTLGTALRLTEVVV